MKVRTGFSHKYLFYALGIIFCANFLNYLDRNIIATMEADIKMELSVSSAAFGFLASAFTIGYILISPFIGYFADRVRRVRLLALCILVWSAATIGCGTAGKLGSYWMFIAMRVLIGVGEAGCLVIGPTLISDYFRPRSRGKALSIFFLGLPLGGAAGYILGGQIVKYFSWQQAFYIAGAPGLLLAALIFFLREPKRGASEGGGAMLDPALPTANFRSYVKLLKTRTLTYIILAQACIAFAFVPMAIFGVNFFEERGIDHKDATLAFGIIALGSGLIGTLLGGFLGDRLRRRTAGSYALLAGIALLIGLPSLIFGLRLVEDARALSYVFLFIAFAMFFMCMPLVNTQIANVVHPSQRAMAFAAAVFILHILGDTISPPLFGVAKDAWGDLLAFTVFPFTLLLGSLFCFLAWRASPKDVSAVGRRVERDRTQIRTRPPGI